MTSTSSISLEMADLLQKTRRHFPHLDAASATISPIEKGGSGRRFYRVVLNSADSVVLIEYDLERTENRHYVRIAQFLSAHEIRAPKIYFHDSEERLIWIEDLGETDLWSYRSESWAVRRPLYQSALTDIEKLHRLPASAADEIRAEQPPPFDHALYRWEQRYFFENCLGRYFGASAAAQKELAELPVLQEIAARLTSLPRVLIHRDFQSQNIIIREDQACLIDFQGMRFGLAAYDLASLLYDPYVDLSEAERDDLLGCSEIEPVPAELVRCCAMQRLMQALGAYGFLGLVRGNKNFLNHIPAAMNGLRSVLEKIAGTERLRDALAQLVSDPK